MQKCWKCTMLVTVLLLLLLLFKQCSVTHHKFNFVLLKRPRYSMVPWYSMISVFIYHGTYSKNYVITTIHVHIIMSKNHSNVFFLYT